jgi:hypothetical protein
MVFYDPHQFFLIWATDPLAAREHVESFGHQVVNVVSVLGASGLSRGDQVCRS